MNTIGNTDIEQRIVEVATQVFIEKGYEEANMSYIAERVGITRPTLHYYFRTKDKLYGAIYTKILSVFIPAIQDTLLKEKPIPECIADIVDIYFDMLEHNPGMPLFAVREIQRDAAHFFKQAQSNTTIRQYVMSLKSFIIEKMEKGQIRTMPLQYIFYTFYGLLFTPFLFSPLTKLMFNGDESKEQAAIAQWKVNVVSMMQTYLSTNTPS